MSKDGKASPQSVSKYDSRNHAACMQPTTNMQVDIPPKMYLTSPRSPKAHPQATWHIPILVTREWGKTDQEPIACGIGRQSKHRMHELGQYRNRRCWCGKGQRGVMIRVPDSSCHGSGSGSWRWLSKLGNCQRRPGFLNGRLQRELCTIDNQGQQSQVDQDNRDNQQTQTYPVQVGQARPSNQRNAAPVNQEAQRIPSLLFWSSFSSCSGTSAQKPVRPRFNIQLALIIWGSRACRCLAYKLLDPTLNIRAIDFSYLCCSLFTFVFTDATFHTASSCTALHTVPLCYLSTHFLLVHL